MDKGKKTTYNESVENIRRNDEKANTHDIPFDYTEWQRDLFNDLSVKELSNLAMKEYKSN